MHVAELDYELPPELIAQRPLERRDESRLLVYDRATGEVRHRRFGDLPRGARRRARRRQRHARRPGAPPDRAAERRGAAARAGRRTGSGRGSRGPTRRLRPGRRYGPVELLEHLGEGAGACGSTASPRGEAPLPPYIAEPLADPERYQTVYARDAGSAAAPTAGLHFTPELLARLDVERVTLHVGLDTFRPVAAETLEEHELHGERYEVAPAAWERIRARRARARRRDDDRARARDARARRAARRPHRPLRHAGLRVPARRRAADELPPAALDAARARDGVRRRRGDARLYRLAVEERYRFYSFGDAMLVL